MRNTWTITLRETRAYFVSPTAYVIITVFLGLTGWFFVGSMSEPFPDASVSSYLVPSTFILVFLAPVLTMRLVAEERKLGTIELLFTSPVRDWQVIVGKYLAALTLFIGASLLTFVYVVLLYRYGDPDTGPIVASYVGFLLFGAAALAIGLYTSSITSNQIVAAVVGFGILLLLSVIHLASGSVGVSIGNILTGLSMAAHFSAFSRGIIAASGVAYFTSVIVLFVFLAVRTFDVKRWT